MLKRYLHRSYGASSAITYRVRRRFTRAGFLALTALVAAMALSFDTNFTVAYQALAFLFCLLAVSTMWAVLSRGRFEVTRELPRFGTAGVPLPYQVTVRNLTRRTQRNVVCMEELPDPRPTLAQFRNTPEPGEEQRNWFDRLGAYYRWRWLMDRNQVAEVADLSLPPMPPRGEVTVAHELIPRRRGIVRLPGVTLAWPDPFGLVRSRRRVRCPQSVCVLPRRYPVPQSALPGSLRYQHGGVALASQVGESEEFVSLREYRPGDSLRHIHWRSWAKMGRPILKEFQDEFFCRHALVLDTFRAEAEGDVFEEAVSVAGSFACTIPEEDSLLDLMFVGPKAYCFTAGRGLAQPEQLLEILASVTICHDAAFSDLEELVTSHLSSMSGCVCVFLAWDADRRRLVERLMASGIPVLVLQIVPTGQGAATSATELGTLAGAADGFHRLEVGRIAEGLAQIETFDPQALGLTLR